MNTTPAFVTGSRIYGTPREDSDYDLVVLISESDYWKLTDLAPVGENHNPSASEDEIHPPLYFKTKMGELNLIIALHPEKYQAWLDARDACIREKPVSRERAIEIHEAFKKRAEKEVAERKKRELARKPAVPRIKKDTYVPKQGGPANAIRNTHYCRKCKSTPCRCKELDAQVASEEL